MAKDYTTLFSQAEKFKKDNDGKEDIEYFFEFNTFELLKDYDKNDWPFIIKQLLKKFSSDEECLCSVILYDILETHKLSLKQWKSIENALRQSWIAKKKTTVKD